MNEPTYQIGDRALVAGLPVTIHSTDYLDLSGKRLYTVRFEYNNGLTIVDESEVNREHPILANRLSSNLPVKISTA
jgi:hypothetical protein